MSESAALRVELWWQIEKRIPHSERDRFDRFAAFVYLRRKRAERQGWDVSYRQRWWHRRLYACGNVIRSEAEATARYMRGHGYRRVRMERSRPPSGAS